MDTINTIASIDDHIIKIEHIESFAWINHETDESSEEIKVLNKLKKGMIPDIRIRTISGAEHDIALLGAEDGDNNKSSRKELHAEAYAIFIYSWSGKQIHMPDLV